MNVLNNVQNSAPETAAAQAIAEPAAKNVPDFVTSSGTPMCGEHVARYKQQAELVIRLKAVEFYELPKVQRTFARPGAKCAVVDCDAIAPYELNVQGGERKDKQPITLL